MSMALAMEGCSNGTGRNNGSRSSFMETAKEILGPEAIVLRLSDFLADYFSSFRLDASEALHPKLSAFLVVPCPDLQPAGKVDTSCRQSLASLVDDAIWFLLQRREKLKGTKPTGPDLLCQGYSVSSFVSQDSGPSMHAAAVMTNINNNVRYWKTNPLCRILHQTLGDQILRTILIHTSVFVPIEHTDDPDDNRANLLQICGVSCTLALPQQLTRTKTSHRRRKGRRPCSTQMPLFETLRPQAHVSKRGLYYSSTFVPKVGLPRDHALSGTCEPETLLNSMIGSTAKLTRRQRKRWRSLLAKGLPICELFIRNHRNCDYHRLLNRCSPLPELVSQTEVSLADVVAAHSPADSVVDFLAGVLSHVIPTALLGSNHNLRQLLGHVGSFVRLRRTEFLANKSLMNGMKVTHASWLFAGEPGNVHRTDHQTAQLLFLRILRWTFGQFIIPLLAATFHITDSEMHGKQVLYYRKPVWSIFRSMSMQKLLKQQYTEISSEEARQRLAVQQMGLSRLRLLPKDTGVRPIAMLCKHEPFRQVIQKPSMAQEEYGSDDDEEIETPFFIARKKRKVVAPVQLQSPRMARSTNQILRTLFSVLRYEYGRQPDLFGAGVDGLHHFYPRYRSFTDRVRSLSSSMPVYFASVDIQSAYDSINQECLVSIVEKILSQREYCMQRYDVVHPYASLSKVVRRPVTRVGATLSLDPLQTTCVNEDFRQSIFVDCFDASIAGKAQLSNQLLEHLQSHLVTVRGRYGDRYLMQSNGIPQGSVLSTALCNFYYGAFERKVLPEFLDSQARSSNEASVLVRMVDDFMLVTTSRALLVSFVEIMEAGDKSLGVTLNESKTRVSVSVELRNRTIHPAEATEERFFPWCGMLFDRRSYGVRIDYARLVGVGIAGGLTVERSSHEGRRFSDVIRTFVRPRCIPILFDGSINDADTQTINFYQLFIFCAAKTVAYLRSSSLMTTLESNLPFIAGAMTSSIKYGHTLIQRRLIQAGADQVAWFTRPLALGLGHLAFYEVFRRCTDLLPLAAILKDGVPSLVTNGSFQRLTMEALGSPGIVAVLSKTRPS